MPACCMKSKAILLSAVWFEGGGQLRGGQYRRGNFGLIRQLAALHRFSAKPMATKNTLHAELNELAISRDLGIRPAGDLLFMS